MVRNRVTPTDQPSPKPNDSTPVWDLVVKDMGDRDRVGRERYGAPLQPFNGRSAKVDAYQEVLDAAVYLRQDLEEVDRLEARLEEVVTAARALAKEVENIHLPDHASDSWSHLCEVLDQPLKTNTGSW